MNIKASLFAISILLSMVAANAQVTSLYSWQSHYQPWGSLTISGNVMYGMTSHGGGSTDGCVFSIDKDGSNYKILWNFDDTGAHAFDANGAYPDGNVILIGDKLYGMTNQGGSNLDGEIFCVRTNGTGFKDLWDFADTGNIGNASGKYPYGSLILIGSKLFGYTSSGGGHGYGTIFSIDTLGHHYKDIYDFGGATTGANPIFGALSVSPSGMVLYGATEYGGADNVGVVYSVDTDGTHFKVLHMFQNNGMDGTVSESSVVLSGNKLFGTTFSGGSGYNKGTVFTIDTAGHNYKLVFIFSGGNYPIRTVGL